MGHAKITLLAIVLLLGIAAFGEERTFPAGSLIIPMDSKTQNTERDGIFEAYGLVYELLNQGVTVYSIIDPDKPGNYDPVTGLPYPDLGPTEVPFEAVNGIPGIPVTPVPNEFGGGPYMIDAGRADAVLNLISQSAPRFDDVVIHRFLEPITAPIGAIYQTTPKRIALMETKDQGASRLMVCYLELADIPPQYYDILTTADIAGGALNVADYYILWVPHWVASEEPGDLTGVLAQTVMNTVINFADNGGNVLLTCKAIDSWEVHHNLMATNHIGINANPLVEPTVYMNLELPFAQIGDYPFVPDEIIDTQSFRNYQTGDTPPSDSLGDETSSTFNSYVKKVAVDSTPNNPWAYYTLSRLHGDPENGNVHYVAGHRYVSCEPIISPGQMYRIDIDIENCKNNKGPTFWNNFGENVTILFEYELGSLEVGPIFDGTYDTWSNDEFVVRTVAPDDPAIYNTNFGQGCMGAAQGDHLDGVFIQNITDIPLRIENITVSFECPGCGDFRLEAFDIQLQTDQNQCGTSECPVCSNVFPDYTPKNCDSEGSRSFIPRSQKGGGTDLIFQGGEPVNPGEPGAAEAINIGGTRYILNTLLNGIVDPAPVREFARSGPVVDGDVLYFGTFEYPGNAGHFRAYDLVDAGGNPITGTLTAKWDAAGFGIMPPWTERHLFTFIDGQKIDVTPENAATIEAFIDDPFDTVEIVAEDIRTFLGQFSGKRLGGIERSTPAIVPPNDRSNPNRIGLAYVGTTFGVLEMIELETGVEHAGYVPSTLLKQMKYSNKNDPDRPKVDASPAVADVFLPLSAADPLGERSWRTVILAPHGSGSPGLSALDITDPENVTLLWEKFDPIVFGKGHRASFAKYKRQIGEETTIGYAAVVTTNIPDGHGLRVQPFDLQIGTPIWNAPFEVDYTTVGLNDIPAPAAVWDFDSDSFEDRICVGDLMGRLWRIGQNGEAIPAKGTTDPSIPLYDAGADRPIAAAPSVGEYKGHKVVAFGTGGTDWATPVTNNIVVVYDLVDDALLIPEINIGTGKIISPISFAGDSIFFIAVEGTVNSPDPSMDLPDTTNPDPDAYLYAVSLDATQQSQNTRVPITKSHGSVYVKNGQTYSGSMDGTVQQYGERRDQDTLRAFRQLIWKDLTNAIQYLFTPTTPPSGD